MSTALDARRDRAITRYIHRLFWSATWVDKPGIILCYLFRIPALIAIHVLIPLAIAYGIEAIVARQFEQVPNYAIAILLLSLFYAVFWTAGGWLVSRNGVIGSKALQRRVFTNYLSKDYEFYTSAFFGALGSQASHIRKIYSEYCQIATLTLPKQIVIVVASVAVLAWHSPLLAAVTLAAMAAVLSFTIGFSKYRLRLRRQLSEKNSDLDGAIGDALSHGASVKSFASESYEEAHLERPLNAWGNIQLRTWRSAMPSDAGLMVLAGLATVILLLMTASMYRNDTISIAVVTLVQLYVIKMIVATQAIADIIKQYETTMGAAYQSVRTMLVEATVLDPPRPEKLPAGNNLEIAFQGVTYHYPGTARTARAVDFFSLAVRPGEKIGLVGYSGSGKTTLTKLLLRFMDTTSGTISVGGRDIREVAQRELRSKIAYVPQEPLLFHRSIFENIAYGRPEALDGEVKRAAKLAYVDEFVADLPKGYNTLVGERGVKLSGGQRQRVAIARALLKDAPILVLDEATSALDSRSEKLIQEALWRLMKDRTALVVAHRLSTIQRMDRIVVMDKGNIVQVGTHAALLKDKKGPYAKLWAHQSGGYVGLPSEETTTEHTEMV